MNRLILDKYQTEYLSTEIPSLTTISALQKPTAYSMDYAIYATITYDILSIKSTYSLLQRKVVHVFIRILHNFLSPGICMTSLRNWLI